MRPRIERKLAAILAADVVGYSRLIVSTSGGPEGGRPPGTRSLFASSSSAMVRSSTSALSRSISRSRPSAGRVLSDASPAARKVARQALNSAPVTPSSRDTSSKFSPRSSLNTALCLRLAEDRRNAA